MAEITEIVRSERITKINLSTDDIETMIREYYSLEGNIDFNWRIGSWVSLEVSAKVTWDSENG